MIALIDTCVIIDFLQRRAPYYEDAYRMMQYAATEEFAGGITAKSATDIYYLTRRCTHSEEESRKILNRLLSVVGLFSTSAEDIVRAVSSKVADFEDAVMVETGLRIKADCIVTCNAKDYVHSSLPVYTPTELIQMLKKENRH